MTYCTDHSSFTRPRERCRGPGWFHLQGTRNEGMYYLVVGVFRATHMSSRKTPPTKGTFKRLRVAAHSRQRGGPSSSGANDASSCTPSMSTSTDSSQAAKVPGDAYCVPKQSSAKRVPATTPAKNLTKVLTLINDNIRAQLKSCKQQERSLRLARLRSHEGEAQVAKRPGQDFFNKETCFQYNKCRSLKLSLLGASDVNVECTRNSGGRALETIPPGLRNTSPAEGRYQQLELDNAGKGLRGIVEGPCKRKGPPTEIVTRQHDDRKPIAELRLSPAAARTQWQEKEALNSPTFAHREPHSSLQAGLEETRSSLNVQARFMRVQPSRLEVPAVHDPKGNGHAASGSVKRWSVGTMRRVANDRLGECRHVGAHVVADWEGGKPSDCGGPNAMTAFVFDIAMKSRSNVLCRWL
ncbi:hypothetical protein EDD17DRAFT_1504664 [Pisolithus thermaeus]|nr:hypothetical protein EV401DRAFT_2194786 [Pisolithus croceorrhizus]KAI6166863.1 hypothetical protein EDD17DRAFT_1504664 [Pisolithus thermaeus]